MDERKAKAVIVGGSIAGISCAHTLILAGWDVLVIEKSPAPQKGSPTGAGLSLDPLTHKLIASWLPQPDLILDSTLPLSVDQNQVTDAEKKVSWTLTRDENFNGRAAHWADLHGILHNALPEQIFLWGHLFLSFSVSDDKKTVTVKAKVVKTNQIIEIVGDLLVAADGSLSSIRRSFLPDLKLRYSGYCAWRGVLDFSSSENSETMIGIRRMYPELGKTIYFDLGCGTHAVFYEVLNKRINWVWYVNQEEPQVKGSSVTMKVSGEMIEKMLEEAEKTWVPELVEIMKATKEPFLNVMYDCDPLERIVWDNVVLVGDAAHPTTPHGVRSTNMSILDAVVLGKCLEKFELGFALEEYQSIRVPVTSEQVMHSRKMGRIKQGLPVPGREAFDPRTARPEDCYELQQKSMPFFGDDVHLFVGSRGS